MLEDYLDTIEALPQEIQRQFTLMQELEGNAHDLEEELLEMLNGIRDDRKLISDKGIFQKMLKSLDQCEHHWKDKLELAKETYDLADRHIRKLDEDLQVFEEELSRTILAGDYEVPLTVSQSTASAKRSGGSSNSRKKTAVSAITNAGSPSASSVQSSSMENNNKRSSARRRGVSDQRRARNTNSYDEDDDDEEEDEPADDDDEVSRNPTISASSVTATQPIVANNNFNDQSGQYNNNSFSTSNNVHNSRSVDNQKSFPHSSRSMGLLSPSSKLVDASGEPLYCYCRQVSFGEMIACDNENCEIEWFHYGCVGLKQPPKGKWYCVDCTNKRKKA